MSKIAPHPLPDGPSLALRAFVTRKAKSLAFRPLRGSLLTPASREKEAGRTVAASPFSPSLYGEKVPAGG
jgi:hypothetical protein